MDECVGYGVIQAVAIPQVSPELRQCPITHRRESRCRFSPGAGGAGGGEKPDAVGDIPGYHKGRQTGGFIGGDLGSGIEKSL